MNYSSRGDLCCPLSVPGYGSNAAKAIPDPINKVCSKRLQIAVL